MSLSEGLRLLDRDAVAARIDEDRARDAVRDAFLRLHRGAVTLPAIMDFPFPDRDGEAHVKGAHLHGAGSWAIKVVTSFQANAAEGLPVISGMSLVLSAHTGRPEAIIADGGYLTELRTAAAGALASHLLARPDASKVLIVGAAGQARYQLAALLRLRDPARVEIWARRPAQALEAAEELTSAHGRTVTAVADLESAVGDADLIITVTAARAPLIRDAWVRPGTHITAVGSDLPGKQELDAALVTRADVVVVDDPSVTAANGELQHAPRDVLTLGACLAGDVPGRTSPGQVTICDLCGLGIQDAAVADVVLRGAGT